MNKYWSKLCCLARVGHVEHKFSGEGVYPPTNFGVRKLRVPVLSRGVVCVILRLAVLIQYRHVTHRQTYVMAVTRASLAPRG